MNKICGIFYNVVKIFFGIRNNNKLKGENKFKLWFNKSCKMVWRKFYLVKKIYNKYKFDEIKVFFRVESKEYKIILDWCIKDYKVNLL